MSLALSRQCNERRLGASVISATIVASMGLKQKEVYAAEVGLEKILAKKIADWIPGDIPIKQSIVYLFTNPLELRYAQCDVRFRKSAANQALEH